MFNHKRQDRELDEELGAYLDMLVAEKIRAGMNPEAARREALVEMGGVQQVKEGVRDVRPGVVLETLLQDLRYSLRTLRKAPAFTAAVVITLALGVGASTAIFSMVDGVLLRRLPIANGDRLVHLTQPSAQSDDDGFAVTEVADLDRDMRTMAAVAEYHSMFFQLYGHGEPLRVQTGVVSDRFFDMLAIHALLGRTFLRGEEAIGAPPVVVLSYRFWMEQFHGDPNIIGASFTMNDRIHHVVGVLPPLPGYPHENDMWMPAGACPFRSAPAMMHDRGMRMVEAFGVLRPGVGIDRARSELAQLQSRYHADYAAAYPAAQRLHYAVVGARDEMTARARPVLLLLLGTAAFLLLAAVANVANLSLARQASRARELALRIALGASGVRIYRQLVLEALLLALGGGALGVLLAANGVGLLRTFATRMTPRAGEIRIDAPVFGFALALSLCVALVIALVPFVHALRQRNVAQALRQGSTGTVSGRGDLRTRSMLVAAQVALAFVLLVGAGLIGRSLVALEHVDAGVDLRDILTARITLNFTKYADAGLRRTTDAEILERLQAIPGVVSVAIASSMPLAGSRPQNLAFQVEGHPAAPGSRGPRSDAITVTPDYFRTLGIPLLRGRTFTLADRDTAISRVIISNRLARTWWPGRDPVGSRITADSGKTWLTVVGVVGDVRQSRLDGDITDEIYAPLLSDASNDLRVLLRARGPFAAVANAVRGAVHAVDPQEPVSDVGTLEQVKGAQLAEPRLATTLLSVFAALALLLTGTGLGGVIAYGVSQRLPEIAIRMALGADRRRVQSLVMREGLAIAATGLVVGGVVAYATTRYVAAMLFHVAPTDPLTYLLVCGVILGTAVAACLGPTRRALTADPAQVLRAG